MKKFMAVYMGSASTLGKSGWSGLTEAERKALQASGVEAWGKWVMANSASIIDSGNPLGKTKRISRQGIADIKNEMTAYTIIQAESHEAAARIFLDHPHFMIFPGDSIEVMECLPIPGN